MSDDKTTEGLAVYWAVMTGACSRCEYLSKCESNNEGKGFEFPQDVACMVRKQEYQRQIRKIRAQKAGAGND